MLNSVLSVLEREILKHGEVEVDFEAVEGQEAEVVSLIILKDVLVENLIAIVVVIKRKICFVQ